MSNGWSWYVIVLVALNIGGCVWLLLANRSAKIGDTAKGEPLDHEFDGVQELNNPLPAWWTWLFVVTIVFSVVYLLAYPGLGNWPGWLGWTSEGQHQAEIDQAEGKYGPIFEAYYAQPIPELLSDPKAIEIGARLFANNCAACHGSDARGGSGYPNLADDDWLFGGDPQTVVQTITHGRVGVMPPLGAAVGGEAGVKRMAQYVLSLSGRDHDAAMAAAAKPQFQMLCAPCHGADATGNHIIGAANLTDDIWLLRGRLEDIENQITNGRVNRMPPHGELLGKEKIHLLALYVLSLSSPH